MKTNLMIISVLTAGLLLSGCGGGAGDSSDSSSSTATPKTAEVSGQFIDSPVEGLSYECSSGLNGTTDINGEFICQENDNVSFSIDNLVLGSCPVEDVITPFHLYTNDLEKAYNLAQLLHSLDEDANPDNNIKLLTGLPLENINIDADSNIFQNSLASALASMGITAYNRDQSSAKMLSYIQTNGNGNNYGLSVNIKEELEYLETLMCNNSESLVQGECQEKTCEDDNYECPIDAGGAYSLWNKINSIQHSKDIFETTLESQERIGNELTELEHVFIKVNLNNGYSADTNILSFSGVPIDNTAIIAMGNTYYDGFYQFYDNDFAAPTYSTTHSLYKDIKLIIDSQTAEKLYGNFYLEVEFAFNENTRIGYDMSWTDIRQISGDIVNIHLYNTADNINYDYLLQR